MSASQPITQINIRSILEKEKLNGTNFLDLEISLRIVLRQERKGYVLTTPIPELPEGGGTAAAMAARLAAEEALTDVTCIMLASMEPDLQKQVENLKAREIMIQLKEMVQEQARTERFNNTKAIVEVRLEKGKPVGPHVLRMIGLFDMSRHLIFPYSNDLATDIILNSLHDGFDAFIINFNMSGFVKTLTELQGMLKTFESTIKVKPKKDVLMVRTGGVCDALDF